MMEIVERESGIRECRMHVMAGVEFDSLVAAVEKFAEIPRADYYLPYCMVARLKRAADVLISRFKTLERKEEKDHAKV
jgi:hypothetical protein